MIRVAAEALIIVVGLAAWLLIGWIVWGVVRTLGDS